MGQRHEFLMDSISASMTFSAFLCNDTLPHSCCLSFRWIIRHSKVLTERNVLRCPILCIKRDICEEQILANPAYHYSFRAARFGARVFDSMPKRRHAGHAKDIPVKQLALGQ